MKFLDELLELFEEKNLSTRIEEVNGLIIEFIKRNHTIDEIEKFHTLLLESTHHRILKGIINKVLGRIRTKVKNGLYKAPPELIIEFRTIKSKKKTNKISPKKKNDVQVYFHDIPILTCNYSDFTIEEFCECLGMSIPDLQRIIRSKDKQMCINSEMKITENLWNLMKDFALNKIHILLRNLSYDPKKQKAELISKRDKFQSSIIRKYYGGNFYKLIYTGMTT
jgi:hypothetical protein